MLPNTREIGSHFGELLIKVSDVSFFFLSVKQDIRKVTMEAFDAQTRVK